jgi:hypothetical protein
LAAAVALVVSNFNYYHREGGTYIEWQLEESSLLALRFEMVDPGGGPLILEEDAGGEDISLLALIGK